MSLFFYQSATRLFLNEYTQIAEVLVKLRITEH